jgi:hypothetical protein
MVVKYEDGSTYFPGYTTSDSKIEFLEPSEIARRVLKKRREVYLLDEPSVMKVAATLAERVRKPDVWIRNSIATIDRFSREICNNNLAEALEAGEKDSVTADFLLQKYISKHEELTGVQLSALLFGPKLWFALNGVKIDWANDFSFKAKTHIANSQKGDFNPAVRLLMLSLIGTGLTFDELATITVKDAGALDQDGKLVPNLSSNPLALEFDTEEGRKITFLGEEARVSLQATLETRQPKDSDLLFADDDTFEEVRKIAELRGKNTIETVNNVNVQLCSTVGNFFLNWGIPGRNFYAENGLPNPYEEKP